MEADPRPLPDTAGPETEIPVRPLRRFDASLLIIGRRVKHGAPEVRVEQAVRRPLKAHCKVLVRADRVSLQREVDLAQSRQEEGQAQRCLSRFFRHADIMLPAARAAPLQEQRGMTDSISASWRTDRIALTLSTLPAARLSVGEQTLRLQSSCSLTFFPLSRRRRLRPSSILAP